MATPPQSPPRLSDRAMLNSVVRIGARRQMFGDLYHALLEAPWGRFLGATLVLYVVVNALFALAYVLGGDCIENARPGSFHDAFFFSVQTMATIGYGKMVPRSSYANILVSFEALCGMLFTAMATGLMFAKFARPTARVLWSRVAVVGRRDNAHSLMLRMANERGNQIVEAQMRLVLARAERTPEGEEVRRFHDLPLTRASNSSFTLSWTAIHPITPSSPLYGATAQSLVDQEVTIIASLVGIDETSGATVHARHTYNPQDIVWDKRFVDIIGRLPDGRRVVHYTRFHDVMPQSAQSEAPPSDGTSPPASAFPMAPSVIDASASEGPASGGPPG